MEDPTLGIAVVTFRSADKIGRCIASIARHAPDSRVVVVENSGEATAVLQAIESATGDVHVTVVDPGQNLGYARAVNLAVNRLSECTHLLILNPDVCLTADPMQLLQALRQGVVATGIILLTRDGSTIEGGQRAPNVRRQVTWVSSMMQALFGTQILTPRQLPKGEVVRVPQVDGAFLFQTMAFYLDNPLNDYFELYYEDVEYCLRAQTAGGVILLRTVLGIHEAGSSARKSNGVAHIANRVSWARYLQYRYPRMPKALIVLPLLVDFLTRSAVRLPEGSGARRRALAAVFREVRRPGSVSVLSGNTNGATPSQPSCPRE